jgi:hypothetical protein
MVLKNNCSSPLAAAKSNTYHVSMVLGITICAKSSFSGIPKVSNVRKIVNGGGVIALSLIMYLDLHLKIHYNH